MKLFNTAQQEARVQAAIDRLNQLAASYQPHAERLKSEVSELQGLGTKLDRAYQDLLGEGRKLRIGIVGQMKAGKSTLVNVLLFGGDEILAKAATPMTAALTYLRYGETPRAIAEFYAQDEWDDILEAARGDARTSEQAKAAQEQLEMIRERGLNTQQFLGQSKVLEAEVPRDLLGRLGEFVGAKGQYTPLVKCMTLELPHEALREIEVIDTPGLNDPVKARSQRTRKDMDKCDVVFLMSYCGKFLDQVDMQLMSQHLPNSAVANCVLVGTKFDSALIDASRDYDSPQEAVADVRKELTKQAQSVLARYQQNVPPDSPAYRMLESLRAPIFVSAMAQLIHDHQGRWTAEEANLHKLLAEAWPDAPMTLNEIHELNNLPAVQLRMEEVAAGAEATLLRRLDELAVGYERNAATLLEQLRERLELTVRKLESSSATQLAEQQDHLSTIKRASATIEGIFGEVLAQAGEGRLSVVEDLHGVKQQYARLQERTATKEESYTDRETRYRRKKILGFIPWFGEEAYTVPVEKTRTVSYQYAAVDDAIAAIDDFASEATLRIERLINDLINRKALKQQLKKAILDTLDPADEHFDADLIGAAIDRVANEMPLPTISLKGANYIKMVSKSFSGQVTGDQISALKGKMREAIAQVVDDLDERFKKEMTAFESELTRTKDNFLASVLESLHDELEQLKADLAKGQAEVDAYRTIHQQVERDLRQLPTATLLA